jgi:hypothetical protein
VSLELEKRLGDNERKAPSRIILWKIPIGRVYFLIP